MSITKKLLSAFLSILIVLSSVSVGLTAFAATKTYSKLDENHQALATALQKEYVADLNNYIKSANRNYVANDNENGDIAEASKAFYNIIDASEKKRYGTAVKAVETTLKSAMGSDYTAEMSKVIGFLCGNGSISAYTSNYVYKFTVNQNINKILNEYENSSDVPEKAKDKATVYFYTQTGSSSSYKTTVKKEFAAASTSAFKNFEAMFNADVLSSDYDKLPDGKLESIEANGQSVIDEASVISDKNIKRLLGKDVSIEAAQAYLDGILLFKAKDYIKLIDKIKSDLDKKKIEDLDFEALGKLKARLDEADKLYNSYVDVQKESVKEAHNDYNELVLFYQDSYNYNKAPEYAHAVKTIEKYADEKYQFTREEFDSVKKALDDVNKKYGEFLGTPTYPSILESKAIYDKALENYTKAYEGFDWQDYYKELNEFAKCFDVDAVLDIPNSAYLDGAKMVLIDDEKQSVYKAEEKFVYLIDFLFTKHKDDYQNIESAVSKITDDLTAVMGKESVKNKDVNNILLNYFNNGPATSKSASKTILIRPPYLFDYATVAEIPEKITYQSNQFVISYNSKTGAYTSYRKSTPNSIDSNAYNVFSLFELTFNDAFLNKDLNACTFDELSLIRRKAIEALELVKEYPRIDIIHFFGEERYAKAQKLNDDCNELMRQRYNEMVTAIIDKYGNRKVQNSEVKAFFDKACVIDNAYNQLSDGVKALDDVKENTEKYNELKLYVKGIKDEMDADEFVKMAKDFVKKYPKSSLSMKVYDEFKNEIGKVLDFYSSCSEETKNESSVQHALDDVTALNEKMDEIFKAYRFEEFKIFAKDNLDPLYTGDLDDAQIVEFNTFDIAKIKQIILDTNRIYGDLSDKAREDKLVVGYMTIVSKLNDRITLLTNPPQLTPYSVSYPNGVSEAQLNEIISNLDNVIASDLIENLAGKSLDKVIDDALNGLLTKDLINTLVGALYPLVADALGSNASVAGALDINVLPKTLAKNIKHYPSVKAALESAGNDWNAVDWELCDWVTTKGVAVTDLDTFIDALGESLSGLTKVLNVLLNGVTLNAIVITLYGNQGYEKDILPLLEALGCDESNGLVNTETFNSAQNDVPQMLRYIIYPLLDRVKEMLKENTVSELLELLPNLGYIIGNDLLNSGFADLVSPLKNQIDLVETLNNAGIDLTNLVDTLNVKLLKNLGIALPLINWNELAGLGSLEQANSLRLSGTRNIVKAKKADVLVYLLYYVVDVLHTNDAKIKDLISSKTNNDVIKNLINTILSNDEKTIVKSLATMLTAYDAPDYNWEEFNFEKTNVNYPNSFNSKDMDKLVNSLSKVLTKAIGLLLNGSLNGLINNNLYTGVIASKLFNMLYSSLDDKTLATVLSNIEIKDANGKITSVDLSKDAVYKNLKSAGFKDAAKVVKNANSLKTAVTTAKDWNIKNANDFAQAICAILAPFNGVITALLAGDGYEVSVLGAVKLYGANGYNNAVKPLLDAIGCETMSVAEYNRNAQKDDSNAVKNILLALFKLIEKIGNDPIKSVVDIIPKASLFIDNGGVQIALKQLLAPLNNILDGVALLIKTDDVYKWLINDLVSGLAGVNLDWNNLQNQIIPILNDKVLGNIKIDEKTSISLALPNIDFSHFAGCMNKTANGYKVVTADSATEIIRYIWNTVQMNKGEIEKLIKSLVSKDVYKTVSPIITNLLNLSADEFIKLLIDLLNGVDASSFKADWSFLYKNYKVTSVSMPNGVTSAELEEVVGILSVAVNNALSTFLDKPLTSLVGDELYKDSVITSLAKSLYSLSEDETVVTVLGLLGCDFSKDAIAKSLKSDYKSVYKSIKKADKLSKADTSKWKWKVTDKKSFAKALVAVLRPFEPALNVLFNSGSIKIAGAVDFKGSNGYANAVKPLLDTLGCKTISASKYAKDAKKNSDNLLLNIINPVLNQVDIILNDPLNKVTKLLPQIANFVNKGGIQYFVECLLYPVTKLLDPVVKAALGKSDVYALVSDLLGIKWNNLHNKIIPLLNDKVLNSITVNNKSLSLLLPPLDWATLAGCGRVKGNSIKADTGKELTIILRYVFNALDKNEKAVMKLVGGKNSTIGQIVKNVLNCGADGLAKIVVNILLKMDTFDNVSWMFKSVLQQSTKYTENLGKEEYTEALNQVDPLISGLVSELAGSSLKGFATGAVYTNNIVNILAKLIYTNLEGLDIGIDLNTVLSIVDVDISTRGVANVIKDYPAASKQIAKCSKWSDVNFDKINWGFKDGDRNGFVNALAAVLRPLYSVLRVVLSGDDLVALGSLHIKGGNGYNTAIIPIAEALDIEPENLVSPKQYAKDANSDRLITDILNPLLDKVEQILDSPVKSLSEMLPNLAYFVYNGGVKASVENLIAPVTRILKEIDPIYSVNIDLSMLDNIDIDSLVNTLIKDVKVGGKPLGIKISDIDLEKLAGRGNIVTYLSARTYNGNRMQAKRIDADKSAVFISVLRYLVENIKYNLDAINNLISGLDIPDNIAGIINQVLTALTTEDVDSVIEMLMDLLFGFGGGTPAIQPVDKTEEPFDPFNLGDYYWAYWVVFVGVTAIVGVSLFLVFRKKKRKSENLLDDKKEGVNV